MSLANDPNGIDLPDWKRYGYASYEAWISDKAGQSPNDWPMPEVPDWSEEDSSDPADQ